MRRLLFPAGLGLLMTACGGGEAIDQMIDQTLWRLVTIAGADIDSEPPASIGFGEGEVGGTTGCNTFGGVYNAAPDDDTISIGPLRSTLVACRSEALAARERAMMASLQSAARYLITADGLELRDGVGEVLSTCEAVEPDLAGSTWDVTGYNTGTQAVRSLLGDTQLTLEFDVSGNVAGSSGCNTFTGAYETTGEYTVVGGQPLSIGPLATTKIFCIAPEGVVEQEGQFQTALANSDVWRLVGSELELRDNDGAL